MAPEAWPEGRRSKASGYTELCPRLWGYPCIDNERRMDDHRVPRRLVQASNVLHLDDARKGLYVREGEGVAS